MYKLTAVCLVAAVALAAARPEEKYTDKFDKTNVEEVITNPRLFNAYLACILDKGQCTPEGKELRSHMEDALQTDCAKCTDAQKSNTKLVMRHLINEKPEAWEELKAKFDKDGKYAALHEKELKELKN